MTREEMIENMQYLSDRVLHGEILLMRWMAIIDTGEPLKDKPKEIIILMRETDRFINKEMKEL